MWEFIVLLAYTLSWTNPTFNAFVPAVVDTMSAARCTGVIELNDLNHIEVHAQQRWSYRDSVIAVINAVGREGQRETFTLDTDSVYVVWLVAVDHLGNKSCQSNPIALNLPTTTVPPRAAEDRPIWFDIAGRRIDKPTSPGVYFKRQGGRVRSIVIVK